MENKNEILELARLIMQNDKRKKIKIDINPSEKTKPKRCSSNYCEHCKTSINSSWRFKSFILCYKCYKSATKLREKCETCGGELVIPDEEDIADAEKIGAKAVPYCSECKKNVEEVNDGRRGCKFIS